MKYTLGLFSAITVVATGFFNPVSVSGQVAVQEQHASAHIEGDRDPFHGGSEVIFKVALDAPLPLGGSITLYVRSNKQPGQEAFSSGKPVNERRMEFVFHQKLPQQAVPGEWSTSAINIYADGLNSSIAANSVVFSVKGDMPEFPTKGTVVLETDKH